MTSTIVYAYELFDETKAYIDAGDVPSDANNWYFLNKNLRDIDTVYCDTLESTNFNVTNFTADKLSLTSGIKERLIVLNVDEDQPAGESGIQINNGANDYKLIYDTSHRLKMETNGNTYYVPELLNDANDLKFLLHRDQTYDGIKGFRDIDGKQFVTINNAGYIGLSGLDDYFNDIAKSPEAVIHVLNDTSLKLNANIYQDTVISPTAASYNLIQFNNFTPAVASRDIRLINAYDIDHVGLNLSSVFCWVNNCKTNGKFTGFAMSTITQDSLTTAGDISGVIIKDLINPNTATSNNIGILLDYQHSGRGIMANYGIFENQQMNNIFKGRVEVIDGYSKMGGVHLSKKVITNLDSPYDPTTNEYSSDYVLICDTSTASIIINLSVARDSRSLIFIKKSASNTVTINVTAGYTFSDTTTQIILTADREQAKIMWDSSSNIIDLL